jgi:ParB family transcriptional regulator, chromosome partitioning protein
MLQTEVLEIPVSAIDPDPGQPRRQFTHRDLEELAESIRKDGLMQPITVRPTGERFMIIAGERRWRAHQLAAIETIRAMLCDDGDPLRIRTLSIIENLHRKDLNVIEESDALAELQKSRGIEETEIAKIIGKPWTFVRDRLKLQKLSADMREGVVHGAISPAQALHLTKISHQNQMIAFKKAAGMNLNHWWLLVDALLEAEQQTSLFDTGSSAEQKHRREITSKYDAMIERVESLIIRSFKSDEVAVLSSVLDGDTSLRAQRLDIIMAHLRRIREALNRAKATQQALSLLD